MSQLEQELQTLLENVSVSYLRTLSYPIDDWYGKLERSLFFKNNPRFAEVNEHRLRELAKYVLDRKADA
jgi:hypothetical protein